MFTVAICDDDTDICIQIEEMINKISKKLDCNCSIDVFYSGQMLKSELNNGTYYDLQILDIELDSIKGMDIAELVRDELEQDNVSIIYISGQSKYTRELFKTRPIEFLDKPIHPKQMEEAFIRAFRLYERSKNYFDYRVCNSIKRIRFQDIIYFESDDKKIIIHTVNNQKIKFYGKLDDLEENLGIDFIRIHKSYIVNNYKVNEFKYDSVILVTGNSLPISQSCRKSVRQKHFALRKKKNVRKL